MIKDEELEELKKHLDENGKLIITDDMSDKIKERYEFINSLNVDLISLLSRKTQDVDFGDEEVETADSDDDYDGEILDEDENDSLIEESDEEISDLNDFF